MGGGQGRGQSVGHRGVHDVHGEERLRRGTEPDFSGVTQPLLVSQTLCTHHTLEQFLTE